ncbi:MAG: hypothetical protein FJ320_09555 [SAR202 cluster bacterium]|nr:hypothetical protein [SAR202 cluster bacterium]
MDSSRKTVQLIYEAFGRGDVKSILGHMTEDVQWEYAWTDSPVPWLRPGRGRDHVARFFGIIGKELDFKNFKVNHVLSEGNLVVALVSLEVTVRSTGKRIIETDEAHIWYFNESGQVQKFRHAADTYQHAQALQRAEARLR